jgi:hypothetical protein
MRSLLALLRNNWRGDTWEDLVHGENKFLISFPSFEDLNVVGIRVSLPSFNAQINISAWKLMEIPHKIELKQMWLHVEGVHIRCAISWDYGPWVLSWGNL